MISHKHKCIYIHIPKTAGTSIKYFLFPDKEIHWFNANYDVIHGWCPKRKIYMQHATAKQLIETNLITKQQWETYYKFSFVRNPWDRAISDYYWLMNDQNIKDSFKNYLDKAGRFTKVLNDKSEIHYRGDHLYPQSSYFDTEGIHKIDFVGRFENFTEDMNFVLKQIGVNQSFDTHINVSKRTKKHYSKMYTDILKEKLETLYQDDIYSFGYNFDDQRTSIDKIKLLFS